ncbi:MAG: reverse transcriptase domain-containing protein [Candidatus Saccharibacteria bacterium]|nr:reverse transcriptase domain-containing protein [Candidatus Saccharibacteria bacterium]
MSLLTQLYKEENLRSAWAALHKSPGSYGVDGTTIDEFRDNLDNELKALSHAIKTGRYKPTKLKGHPLEKGNNTSRISDRKEYRILKIPTVRDRVVQKTIEKLIYTHLDKKYRISNKVSFAYVSGGGVERAAKEVHKYHDSGNRWTYKADIIKFFDKINKEKMLKMIEDGIPDNSIMPLIEAFLRIDIANSKEIKERTKEEYKFNPMLGVAQGSPLSPMFANVFLSSLDKELIENKYNAVRYADDLVILTKTKEEAMDAHVFVKAILDKLDLEVHDLWVRGDIPTKGHEKKSKVDMYNRLFFLGLRFTGSRIYASGESYEKAIWTVRRAANNTKLSFVEKLISIEARIVGWCSAYAFADYLEEPTKKNDKLLEDILIKLLRQNHLKTTHNKTALEVLGISTYSKTLQEIKEKRKPSKQPDVK